MTTKAGGTSGEWIGALTQLRCHILTVDILAPSFSVPRPRARLPSPLSGNKAVLKSTERLHILSWNPGPVRGDNILEVAECTVGPWHVVCARGRRLHL